MGKHVKRLLNISVLIVDDESGLREVLREELELEGAIVIDAENGAIALNHFNSAKFDVVISDFRMPGSDGISFLKEVRLISPTHPVFLLCTGYSSVSNEEAIALGASALIPKPYDVNFLVEKILHFLKIADPVRQ